MGYVAKFVIALFGLVVTAGIVYGLAWVVNHAKDFPLWAIVGIVAISFAAVMAYLWKLNAS